MHKDWINERDLNPFLELLAQFCGYPFTEADEDAIFYGIKETEYEGNRWFEYVFEGKDRASFRLSKDVGTEVVFFEIAVNADIERKTEVALYVLNYLRTRHR